MKYDGEWRRGGPVVPLEFSRISRDKRLTLVIDPKNGSPVSVRYTFSTCESLTAAITDSNEREDKPGPKKIGVVDFSGGGAISPFALNQHPDACAAIKQWGATQNVDAVIWTELESNFAQRRVELWPRLPAERQAFSIQNALEVIGENPASIAYVRNAPEEVITPVRTAWEAARR